MRLSAFEHQVKLVLEHYHDRDWLQRQSPLAEPYFLGAVHVQHDSVVDPVHWGRVLQQALYASALTLWGTEPPADSAAIEHQLKRHDHTSEQYAFWVLVLNYFHTYLPPNTTSPLTQATIYTDILHISRATHDRHLHAAIHALSERFLAHMHPTLRPEQPRLNKRLIGRPTLHADCLAALRDQQTVSLTGVAGSGKTTLGVAISRDWPEQAVFWFTIRPTLNDRLPSLLFALGDFFRQQGSASLWQHLLVQRGAMHDVNMALALVRHDLAHVAVPPLLCFDDVDVLRPADHDQVPPEYTPIVEFLNSLRGYVAVLLLGQQAVIDSDQQRALGGLTASEIDTLLTSSAVPHTNHDTQRLLKATGGNPRLLELCLALRTPHEPLTTVLDQLPPTLAFHPIFDRLWQRLAAHEREALTALSIFRSAAPKTSLQHGQAGLVRLLQCSLVHEDHQGGVALLPVVRHAIYYKLSAEARQRGHMHAAQVRASLGEYTSALYHYQQAGMLDDAIAMWYPHMEQEIRRGHGPAALQTVQHIVIHELRSVHAQQHLALIRARLYRLTGEADKALAELNKVPWAAHDVLTVEKIGHEGFFLQIAGDTQAALVKNQEGLDYIDRLLEKRAEFLVHIGRIHQRKRDIQQARLAAQRIKYEWERLQGSIEEEAGNVATARTHLWSALVTAEGLNDETLIATCYYHLAILEARLQHEASALEYFHKAIDQYDHVGDVYQAERTRANIAALYVQLEQYANVIEPAERALQYFQMIGHGWMIAAVAANLAEACFYLGDVTRAERYANEVLHQEEQQYLPYALYTLGLVRQAHHDWHAAEECFGRSAHLAEHNEDPHILAYALQQWGGTAMQRGSVAEATHQLRRARELFQTLKLTREVHKTTALLEEASVPLSE